MNDQKENVKKLIYILSTSEEKKQKLLNILETNGVTEGLLIEIKAVLVEMDKSVRQEFPEEAKAWNNIQKETEKQESKALKELNKELTQVDKDLKDADKQFSKQMDEVEIEATKKQLE